mmetsp:Transcript_400/g.991  ORF Transcript_400/g.991 Transcript_400/m.991 type:complete len:200 (-) Transcript_400:20-619(-)
MARTQCRRVPSPHATASGPYVRRHDALRGWSSVTTKCLSSTTRRAPGTRARQSTCTILFMPYPVKRSSYIGTLSTGAITYGSKNSACLTPYGSSAAAHRSKSVGPCPRGKYDTWNPRAAPAPSSSTMSLRLSPASLMSAETVSNAGTTRTSCGAIGACGLRNRPVSLTTKSTSTRNTCEAAGNSLRAWSSARLRSLLTG